MFLWQRLCPVCVSWCHYVTWKTNVENRMCWSCCLVFRLCFSPWQLLITRPHLSVRTLRARSTYQQRCRCWGWRRSRQVVNTLAQCVCRCFVCWDSWNLCLLCTECHINMLNIWWTWPHSSVITQRWSSFGRYKSSYLTRWLPIQITEMWCVWRSNTSRVLTLWVWWETWGWAHPTVLDQYYMLTSYTWWLRWNN